MIIRGYIEQERLEQMVYKKLQDIGITDLDYPINPYDLIKNEGIILQEMQLDDTNIRGMLVNGDNVSGIVINANRSYASRRFIAMHELCHYWFHPKNTKTVCFEEYSLNKRGIEWQANNAAAFALMPTNVLTYFYEMYSGNIKYLCSILQVSEESLRARLDKLELNNKCVYSSFIEKGNAEFIALENAWLYGGM